ncbi:MAG: hypothetical protein SWQ30_03695 [Thermodesulfobacteriota bacterium]|nr:hypothetical protein [Thermodesulfobacteriota bacterium]
MKKYILISLVLLASVSGWWLAQENIELFEALGLIKSSPADTPEQAIDKGKIAVGMETWQVTEALGPPEKRDVETSDLGMKKERWTYGDKSLYFTDGVLTAWQEGKRDAKGKKH